MPGPSSSWSGSSPPAACSHGRTIARLGPGNFFGELSLLDGGPRTASAITEAPSRFLTLPRSSLRAALRSDGRQALRILETIAGRVRQLERPLVG